MSRADFARAVGCSASDEAFLLGVRSAVARMCWVTPASLTPDLTTEQLVDRLPCLAVGWDELDVLFCLERFTQRKIGRGDRPLTSFGKSVPNWNGPGSAVSFGAWVVDTVQLLRDRIGPLGFD